MGNRLSVTGFGRDESANQRVSESANSLMARVVITDAGVYTLSLQMREDGLRIDRLLLTTDTTYLPSGFGPVETARQSGMGQLNLLVDRVINYDYDPLYRLIEAVYTPTEAISPTSQLYEYEYDPVGNRLEQIINGDTTTYQ